MLLIRKFEPGDAESVSSLIRHTMEVSNGSDYPLEHLQPLIDYFSAEKVLLLGTERECLVAEVDRRIVGTVAIEKNELATFFVHPDFQGMGIGTQLLESIERIAAAAGVNSLRCEASLTAVSFYEKKGYRQTGRDKVGAAGRRIIMEKSFG